MTVPCLHERFPEVLRPVLDDYLAQVDAHLPDLLTDWGIQWTVLGVLRQYYTLRENSITTKVKAGKYALDCLPERWHRLVQEALNIRLGKKGSAYRWSLGRASEATRFLRYIIRTCNAGCKE